MLGVPVELRQRPDRQVDELLEEQSEQRPQARDVVRRDADIDRMQRVPQLPEIEVALRCRGIDPRIEPQRELGRDRLAYRVDQVGRALEVVLERLHRRLGVGLPARAAGLDPRDHQRRRIGARQQAKHLADGQRQLGCLSQERRRADERRAGGIRPERLVAADLREDHLRDPLDVLEGVEAVAAHVAQGIVARRPAVRRQRIEQEDLLAGLLAHPGRRGPVLLLDVEADQAALVEQAVRDHEADALARARRRIARDVLGAAEPEIAAARGHADEQASELREELPGFQLAGLRPAGLAMQLAPGPRPPFPQQADHDDRERQSRRDGGGDLEPQADNRLVPSVIGPVEPPGADRHAVVRADQAGSNEEHDRRHGRPQQGEQRGREQPGQRLGGRWPFGEIMHATPLPTRPRGREQGVARQASPRDRRRPRRCGSDRRASRNRPTRRPAGAAGRARRHPPGTFRPHAA